MYVLNVTHRNDRLTKEGIGKLFQPLSFLAKSKNLQQLKIPLLLNVSECAYSEYKDEDR